jgi:hypothetical protein
MLLVKRTVVYVQAVLLLAMGVLGFALGYVMGQARARVQARQAAEEAAETPPVVVQGTLVYEKAPGELAPDEDAVALALPTNMQPDIRFQARGLRPDDRWERDRTPGLEAIASLGGDYARANAEGRVELVVRKPGDYYLLLISKHADRRPGDGVRPRDATELSAYFESPLDLLGTKKYDWSVQHFSGTPSPFNHSFGKDEQ